MPLKPLVFEVLLALVDGPRHGWSLVRELEDRLGGESLLPGNFYRTLRRMTADGLIREARTVNPHADERRRYFELTPLGERSARAEAKRFEALLGDARTRRLLRAR